MSARVFLRFSKIIAFVLLALVAAAAVVALRDWRRGPPLSAATEGVRHVHLALRTDDRSGTGTEADPFDASSAPKFDALMSGFWKSHGGRWVNGTWLDGDPLVIQLSRGVFETAALSSYGPNAGQAFATQHWLAKGWTLRGAGMAETEIRNVHPNTGGVWMFSSTGGSWGGPESGEITVADLTLNPQKTVHEDLTKHAATITSADGTTTTATKPNHGWQVATRIEVDGENYDGPNGPWNGGGWKLITAVTQDTFSWNSTNTRTGEVTVRRVGEWNGLRLNGAGNRAERARVIDGGANSMTETWPLWVGGNNSIVDSCVVEQCSGNMSGIAMFPGTNRTVRNCRVDAAGCLYSQGISAVELVENCTVQNTTFAIYADTFSSSVLLHIRDNVLENVSGGGVVIRPHDHTQKIAVTGNRVRGVPTAVGVWIDPLSNHWNDVEWPNATGEKIWIDDVKVAENDLGYLRIEMSQSRGVTITNNIAGAGAFYRMPPPENVSGNRTPAGEEPVGLTATGGQQQR